MVKNALLILSVIMMLAGVSACSDDDSRGDAGPEIVDDGMVYVCHQDIRRAEGLDDATDEEDQSAPIITENFKEGDLLYFSQLPPIGNPNFTDDLTALNYMYVYQYNPESDANWNSGYNFQVKTGRDGFNWDNVISVGAHGNTFKFFGFFFPGSPGPVWSVKEDQTGGPDNQYDKSNFISSDIMGAYHATSAIYTRMRFRLFHLMTYLMVKIYVPVYDGTDDDYNNLSYSGFNEGALQGGYVLNAYTDFKIEWAASKSSDTEAPLVQPDDSKQRRNIKMYRHDIDETEVKEIDVTPYYGGKVEGIENNMDKVRTYQFSVLFPTQNFTSNLLCFALTTPGGDTKYYYFNPEWVIGGEGLLFGLTQGTLQQINLYLPRKTNQTILVGAKIIPWKDAETDMTVNKQNQAE